MPFTITHRIVQRMELDLSGLSAEDVEAAQELHREPDIYLNDESFPGEMTWRVVEHSAVPSPGRRKALSLARTIDFVFTCRSPRAIATWAQDNVALDDALLPSHVAGDFEGILVGDRMIDYNTVYLGPCS